ncbi:MAG: hypothetical protein WC688_01850 [Parachlamydiales bacterium]|jgi:hypothetical protein
MNLSPSFSSTPGQDPLKYYRNILLDFKKEVDGGADIEDLSQKMEILINASKEMKYLDKHKKGIFHKPETDKTISKVFTEFDRYVLDLQKHPSKANRRDLLNAIASLEALLKENEIY